ncbi:S-adenosyl-L-methionine-dependent methyltransferase [Mycena alexandri]|uniref:S-adenosyl-L-methionine-dependent methyltransferase n=1 Tax=Mycena alexandri TaxID=1745969 RepID=A0AAD6TJV8_9AGAR|nr:S-adenosyl-L-methionine-dependent methyltransferase [Mycena alexandri]
MAPAVTATVVNEDAPESYEVAHVHDVYDAIASHFSSTRYKPWPIIAAFLANLQDGWVGLDSGTGNGKYLPLPLDRPGRQWTIGLDRSRNLLEIARTAGGASVLREVVWGDVLGHGWRREVFDYAISIATIHHLATPDRRKLAVERLLGAVSPAHGRVLIYVWATRQDEHSKRNIPTNSSGTGQDVFVPWVLAEDSTQVFNRYYHMFDDGELAALVTLAAEELGLVIGPAAAEGSLKGIEIVQDGWERSNHYVELRRWQT